jgi:hypothetical protein
MDAKGSTQREGGQFSSNAAEHLMLCPSPFLTLQR